MELCTPVMHRVSGKVHGGVMSQRWHEGFWLGKCHRTEEHYVGMRDGSVVRARSIRERPSNQKVTKEEIDALKQSPWMNTSVISEGMKRGVGRSEGAPDDSVGDRPESRGVRIRKTILEKVGYTPGCPKCKATELENAYKMKTSHHTETERKRNG